MDRKGKNKMREPLVLVPNLNQTSVSWREVASALLPMLAIMPGGSNDAESIFEMADRVLGGVPDRNTR